MNENTGTVMNDTSMQVEETPAEIVVRVPKDKLVPSLLKLIKDHYIQQQHEHDPSPEARKMNMEMEFIIEDAIFTWIDEIKKEKTKKDLLDRVRRHSETRW